MPRKINEIPIKITAVKKREVKLSKRQKISLLAGASSWSLITLLMYRVSLQINTDLSNLLFIVVEIIVTLLIIRLTLKGYFDEDKMYEKYKNKDERFKLNEIWDVMYMDKSGTVLLQNKEFGGYDRHIVVKLERSNVIGRDDEFENRHYRGATLFIRKVLSKGYKIRRYNLSVHDINERPLEALEKSRVSLNNKKLQDSMDEIIKYNKECVRKLHNRTVEYYVIETSGSKDRLEADVSEALALLNDTLYKPEICRQEDLIDFYYGYFKLKFIDTKQLTIDNLPADKVVRVISTENVDTCNDIFKPILTKEEMNLERFKKMKEQLGGLTNETEDANSDRTYR